MVTALQDEEPGFEADVNELPDDNNGLEDTLEKTSRRRTKAKRS